MPFKSQAQRKLMYARHPEIAERWRKESGPQRDLPERKPSSKRKAGRGKDQRRQQLIAQFLRKQRHGR